MDVSLKLEWRSLRASCSRHEVRCHVSFSCLVGSLGSFCMIFYGIIPDEGLCAVVDALEIKVASTSFVNGKWAYYPLEVIMLRLMAYRLGVVD